MPVDIRSKATIAERNRENASHPHYDTPKKARVREAISTLQSTGVYNGQHTKQAVFDRLGVSKTQGYAILRQKPNTDRTFPTAGEKETRGAPHIISQEYIWRMEEILRNADVEERAMTWLALGEEAGLNRVSERTIQRAIGRLDYHKCVACQRGWVSKDLAERRVEFAKRMLVKYPNPDQWKRVRFSDEVHFSLGPQGKLMIIRKPGERYCRNYIQEEREPEEIDKKKLHAWAAVGFNFKSELVFYTIPSNSNGKMTIKVYAEEILEKHVKSWLDRGDDFVLEEDRDSSHGIGSKSKNAKDNIVQE
jgi:hypothetical protein